MPDLAYPLTFDPATGDFRAVRIGSAAEIAGCVQHIADTPRGSQVARPAFGRPDLTGGQGPSAQVAAAAALEAAIDEQEPRAAGQYDIVIGRTGIEGFLTVDVRSIADDTASEDA